MLHYFPECEIYPRGYWERGGKEGVLVELLAQAFHSENVTMLQEHLVRCRGAVLGLNNKPPCSPKGNGYNRGSCVISLKNTFGIIMKTNFGTLVLTEIHTDTI